MEDLSKLKGTHQSEKAPWETWDEEMGDSKMSPELQEAVKRYEERRYQKTSSQNEEELARQKELSSALVGDYQWVKPEEYYHVGPRIGRVIHSSELIQMLRNDLDLRCWYSGHTLPRRLSLTIQKPYSKPEYALWLMDGFMPEYSIMRFDDHFVPLDERLRGWRTVLLQLLLKEAITEEQINRVFGKAQGPACHKYNALVYEFRNRKVKVKEE